MDFHSLVCDCDDDKMDQNYCCRHRCRQYRTITLFVLLMMMAAVEDAMALVVADVTDANYVTGCHRPNDDDRNFDAATLTHCCRNDYY